MSAPEIRNRNTAAARSFFFLLFTAPRVAHFAGMKVAVGFYSLLLLALTAHADLVIVQKVESPQQSGNMTIKVKDAKARADIAAQISTITDGATGDTITLMHTQ